MGAAGLEGSSRGCVARYRMSLVVFVSTDDGIVVVGDRAKTGARGAIGGAMKLAGGAVTGASKVFTFDNNTVYGVTGTPTIGFLRNDGKALVAFDAATLIAEYGNTHAYSPDGDAFWDGLTERITSELMVKAPPGPAWQPPADGFLFQAMFAHVPRDNSFWSYRCFRLFAVVEDGRGVNFQREVVQHPMPSTRERSRLAGDHEREGSPVRRRQEGGDLPAQSAARTERIRGRRVREATLRGDERASIDARNRRHGPQRERGDRRLDRQTDRLAETLQEQALGASRRDGFLGRVPCPALK